MLVLTRKQNEAIVIDQRITVRLLRVQGNRIRIGIEAPEHVAIRRGELDPTDYTLHLNSVPENPH